MAKVTQGSAQIRAISQRSSRPHSNQGEVERALYSDKDDTCHGHLVEMMSTACIRLEYEDHHRCPPQHHSRHHCHPRSGGRLSQRCRERVVQGPWERAEPRVESNVKLEFVAFRTFSLEARIENSLYVFVRVLCCFPPLPRVKMSRVERVWLGDPPYLSLFESVFVRLVRQTHLVGMLN